MHKCAKMLLHRRKHDQVLALIWASLRFIYYTLPEGAGDPILKGHTFSTHHCAAVTLETVSNLPWIQERRRLTESDDAARTHLCFLVFPSFFFLWFVFEFFEASVKLQNDLAGWEKWAEPLPSQWWVASHNKMGDISKVGRTVPLRPVQKLELCRPDADEPTLNSDLFRALM